MKNNWIIILIFCLTYFMTKPVMASQTVFNVPSADILPKGKMFVEPEFQFRPWNPGGFMLNTNYLIYGIGHNTEVGATLYNVSYPSLHNVTLGTGFKSAIPIFNKKYPKREYKITIGTEVLASLESKGSGNWTYGHLSGRTPVTNTRLTAGVSAGTKDIFGVDTVCFIGAIEQPVTKKLTLLTDWFSGSEHFAGFLISGISYTLPADSIILVGFQVPNNTRNGNSGFVLELAKTF